MGATAGKAPRIHAGGDPAIPALGGPPRTPSLEAPVARWTDGGGRSAGLPGAGSQGFPRQALSTGGPGLQPFPFGQLGGLRREPPGKSGHRCGSPPSPGPRRFSEDHDHRGMGGGDKIAGPAEGLLCVLDHQGKREQSRRPRAVPSLAAHCDSWRPGLGGRYGISRDAPRLVRPSRLPLGRMQVGPRQPPGYSTFMLVGPRWSRGSISRRTVRMRRPSRDSMRRR